MQKFSKRIIFALLMVLMASPVMTFAGTAKNLGKEDEYLKTLRKTTGLFDLQKNKVSNIEFYSTNYGILGLNVGQSLAGGVWPRGSVNSYIFGGGIWFGAQKRVKDQVEMRKFVEVSYNPNSGQSWMRPGRYDDDAAAKNDVNRNKIYFSTDYKSDGQPLATDGGTYGWPIWDASTKSTDTLKYNRYFGYYIYEPTDRKVATYPKGPAYISGEDIFSTYHDMDLTLYEGGTVYRRQLGYPLGLQYEQMIYSWGFGEYKDFMFIVYNINNVSADTLFNCWMAPVMDVDIALSYRSREGADNDRVKFYNTDTTLNMAVQWSNTDRGERGMGFGYLAFDFLESPAAIRYYDTTFNVSWKDETDTTKGKKIDTILNERMEKDSWFVRKDKPYYTNKEQLGLRTFRNWPIAVDPKEDAERYAFIAAGIREGDKDAADLRFMMATGPFHMRPHDTTRVVVGIIFANSSKGVDPDGSDEDMADIVKRDKFAQDVYDNNFKAPQPPDLSIITGYKSMNHAISFTWDSTAEMSIDKLERGLAFMGYKIYRARRTDLDTFDVNNIVTTANQKPRGPLGWKEMARFSISTPFLKTDRRAGTKQNDASFTYVDSLMIVGPYLENGIIKDSMKIAVMRIPVGAVVNHPVQSYSAHSGKIMVDVVRMDTGSAHAPWGDYFAKMYNSSAVTANGFSYSYENPAKAPLIDSIMLGYMELDRAVMKYNPIFFRSTTVLSPSTITDQLLVDQIVYNTTNPNQIDMVYLKGSRRTLNVNNKLEYYVDVLTPLANINQLFRDPNLYIATEEAMYSMIKNNLIKKIVFPTFDSTEVREFEQSSYVRNNIIEPYMRKVTNNRTFVDIGDDNGNGVIDLDEDVTKTEQLVNNVPYYYKILAYDEGDYLQPTNLKFNAAAVGSTNQAETYPMAARIGNQPQFNVTFVDSAKMGGLYNFKFYAVDYERARQEFAGKTLELEFNPVWRASKINFNVGKTGSKERDYGLYTNNMILRDSASGKELFNGVTYFEIQPCDRNFRGLLTEKGFTYIYGDTVIIDTLNNRKITFGLPFNKDIVTQSGKFNTGTFEDPGQCYAQALLPPAYGTLGFSFDYTMQQYGGYFRPDTAYYSTGVTATTRPFIVPDASSANAVLATQGVGSVTYVNDQNGKYVNSYYVVSKDASFNNGPGLYEIEFTEGGTEEMTISWYEKSVVQTNTFNVPYLNMKVKNITSFNRYSPDTPGKDSASVQYPLEVQHMVLPLSDSVFYNNVTYDPNLTTQLTALPPRVLPDPRVLVNIDGRNGNEFIGKFNIFATGLVNAREVKPMNAKSLYANQSPDKAYVGTQGRYYLSAKSTKPGVSGSEDVLDICHTLDISGCFLYLDYTNKGFYRNEAKKENNLYKAAAQLPSYNEDKNYTYGDNFKVGDKIYFNTFGGAFGLPLPGAKVRVKISESAPAGASITDDLMDQIKVVPNPYMISHQGQKSPYDAKLYFTKLPRICTIDIYTINGDLVKSINHNEDNDGNANKASLDIWNLLTKNGQRIASQAFVAVIKTPDGAQTTKNFSVVVGGFTLTE